MKLLLFNKYLIEYFNIKKIDYYLSYLLNYLKN